MALGSEVLREIEMFVRGGFDDRKRIVEIFCQERYAPGELDARAVKAAVGNAFDAVGKEERTWPRPTDCDKLDAAFAALNHQGVIALQNAGYTQSDGYSDIRDAYQALADRSGIVGYCFYQGQDLEGAVQGAGLYLAFGPIDPRKERTAGPRVGRLVVKELSQVGLSTKWNGTFKQRIFIPKLIWRRCRSPQKRARRG